MSRGKGFVDSVETSAMNLRKGEQLKKQGVFLKKKKKTRKEDFEEPG